MVCGTSGDLTGAKGAETVPRPTCLDAVAARAGRALGVSERRLGTRASLEAFAQVAGEERPVHLGAEC